MYPAINWRHETIVDVFMDKITDLTCHTHYTSLTNPNSSGRVRGRSVPTHRLNMDLAEDLAFEADSMMEPARNSSALNPGNLYFYEPN